jgi:CHAT domain-containing protein
MRRLRFVSFLCAVLTMADYSRGQSRLGPGEETKAHLSSVETAMFEMDAMGGQYIRLAAVAPESAVGLRVFDASGQRVAQATSLGGTGGAAEAALFVETNQTFRVEVRLLRTDAVTRDIGISIVALRVATEQDREDAAAHRAFSKAVDIRAKIGRGDRAAALAALEEPLRLARAAEDSRLEISLAMAQCETLAGAAHYQDLIAAAEAALPLARSRHDGRAEGQFLYADALAHLQTEDSSGAIPLFEQSLSAAREGRQQYEISQALQNLSAARYLLGDCRQALEEAQSALAIRRELGDRARQGYSLRAIAGDHICLGDAQHALNAYGDALAIFRDLKDQGNEAAVLNGRGVIQSYTGDWEAAEVSHRDALTLRTKLNDTLGASESLINLGAVRNSLGHYREAQEDCAKGLTLARENHHRRSEAYALQCLGEALTGRPEPAKAAAVLDESIQLFREIKDRGGEAWAWQVEGKLQQSQKDAGAAQRAYDNALELESAVGDRIGETITREALARVFREEGDRERALASVEKAISLIESSRSLLVAGNLRAAYMASKREAYELKISLLGAKGAAEGFRTSELSHARVLLDMLAESKIDLREGLDARVRVQQDQLEARIHTQTDVLARLADGTREQLAGARAKLDRLYTEEQDLEAGIKESNPRFAALVLPTPSSVADLRHELLDDDSVLVEYFAGDERSYCWALTSTSIGEFELPGRAELQRIVRRFYQEETERNREITSETVAMRKARYQRADEAAAKDARALDKLLLGPAGQLKQHRVIIVPDGPLSLVPFAALLAGREVITLPSGSILVAMHKNSNGAKDARLPALLIADPVFSSDDPRLKPNVRHHPSVSAGAQDLARLEWSREEARQIAALAPANQVEELLDFSANVDALHRGDLARFAVIHIAAHAMADTVHPELTGIALSGVDEAGRSREGFLRLHDIYNLTLHPTMVVLSSCRTAVGPEVRGEGIMGLSRGFLYAGAQSVIATLWSVDDQATAQFMARFYRELWREGRSPAAALELTQEWMIQQDRWRSPYYWAAFTLTGDWR